MMNDVHSLRMYIVQQFPPLLPGDAVQGYIVWSLPVELSILDAVCRGLPCHTLRFLLLLRQGPLC